MSEQEIFNWLKLNYLPDLQPTSQFAHTDAYSRKHNLNIEIKTRYKHYDDLMVEKYKWDWLMTKTNVRYLVYTPKGIYSFDIKSIPEPDWKEQNLCQTYNFENRSIVKKLVGFINISSAKVLKTFF